MFRLLLAGLVALLIVGCSPPPPCQPAPIPPPAPGGAGVVAIFGDSTPVDLSFSVATSTCSEVRPDSVTVEVLGPTNLEVANTVAFRAADRAGGTAVAQVAFTPKTPGYYHVTATFMPVGGRLQRDLLVVHDRSIGPDREMPSNCSRTVFRTDTGLMLCGGFALNDANVLTSTFTGSGGSEQVVARGNTAWVYSDDPNTLDRFVVSGEQLVHSPDASIVVPGVTALFPVNDHEVVGYGTSFSSTGTLALIRSDGGVTFRSAPTDTAFTGTTMTGIVRPPWFFLGSLVPSENPELKNGNMRVCAYSLDPDQFAADGGGCWTVLGEPKGAGRDGIFTWSDETKTVRLASNEAADGGFVLIDALTLSPEFDVREPSEHTMARDARLTFLSRTGAAEALFVPRRQDNRIVLDRYRFPSSTQFNAAQDEFTWTNATNGVLLWRTHP